MTSGDHSLTMAASHIINAYLWEMLTEHLGGMWRKIERGGTTVVPILPAQEQPEVQDTDLPYMVYVYDYGNTGGLFQYQNETLTLRLFSSSASVIAATTKLCMRLFNKYDESAFDVNTWLMSRDEHRTGDARRDKWIDEMQNFQFKTIHVSGTQGVQPTTNEDGRMDSIITIELEYIEFDMGTLSSNNG